MNQSGNSSDAPSGIPADAPSESPNGFKRYFTLEEAVASLPEARETLARAQREMNEMFDDMVLCKRLLQARREAGQEPSEPELALLNEKYETMEQAYTRWVAWFGDRGILLRDLKTGLIDFPYRARTNGQDYFLCWRGGEDGIFYFHPLTTGFAGRHPIALLPD